MSRQIICECGYIARGETDDVVVAGLRSHLRSDHPGLDARLDDSTIRGWVEIFE